MGYELELPTRDFYAATTDLRRLERAAVEADRRLAEAVARSRALHGYFRADDPLCLASQIRVAHARQQWREAMDALADLTVDAD